MRHSALPVASFDRQEGLEGIRRLRKYRRPPERFRAEQKVNEAIDLWRTTKEGSDGWSSEYPAHAVRREMKSGKSVL